MSTSITDTEAKFDSPPDWAGTELPPEVAAHPLLDAAPWRELRDNGPDGEGVRLPLEASELADSWQARAEFLVGVWMLDKLVPPRLGGSLLANLQPQMLRTVDVLAAELFVNAVLEPRRSSKTTTLWCVLLGRCWMRPVYMAGYTMLTTAKKAGERFKLDVRDPITRKWRDKAQRPVKLTDGNGNLGVEFPNGSKLAILSPNGDDVRSGGYDVLVLDEGGEAEPDMWDEIVGAVLPSFDTRGPGAQLIYAGTGGTYRDGSHFWATLHDPAAGRIRYGVGDDIADAAIQTWEQVEPLVKQLHPGLDGLTNLEAVRRNFPILGPQRFGMEYLGHFGRAAGNDTIVSLTDWDATTRPGPVPVGITPLALAFAIHPGGVWSSIAVAWYEQPEDGDLVSAALELEGAAPPQLRPAFKVVHHQDGNANMGRELWAMVRDTNLPVVYDAGNAQEREAVAQLQRLARPRADLKPMTFAEKAVAHTKLLNAIKHREVDHWAQLSLDKAAGLATKRLSGKSVLLGIPDADPEADITGLEAGAAALQALPDSAPEDDFGPIMATG